MITRLTYLFILSCLFTVNQENHFKPLYVLAGGTWVMKTKKGFICERWEKINDSTLQDQGFRVTGNDTTIIEEVRLVQKDGHIYYIPTVKNQNAGKAVPFIENRL